MDERRTLERLQPYYYLRVYDQKSGECIGSVFDLSKGGMRIASEKPFEKNIIYSLRMLLPEDSILGEHIDVEAKACWCEKKSGEETNEAGFEFVGEVGDGIHVIGALVSDLKDRDLI